MESFYPFGYYITSLFLQFSHINQQGKPISLPPNKVANRIIYGRPKYLKLFNVSINDKMCSNNWDIILIYYFLQFPGSFSSFTETVETTANLNLTRTESEITVLSRHSERSTEEGRVQSGSLVNSTDSPRTSSDLTDSSRIRKGNLKVFL